MNEYLSVLKKYVEFNGRARRRELWMFVLFNFIIAMAIAIIGGILRTGLFSTIYSLAIVIPSIAVGVRRLHDIGKSGWFYLISLIPIIGPIWLIVLFCMDGTPGENAYGPNPKEII